MTRKIIILLVSIVALATCGVSVSAESITDPTGDVYHWRNDGTMWGWDTDIGTKPNIDITDLSYSVNGQQVTVSMTVAGTITNSELVSYWAYLNTSDSSYLFSWNNNQGIGYGMNTGEGSYNMDYDPEITASGNTISVTYDVVGSFDSNIEYWGWAAEYTEYSDITTEWWADWAPETYAWYEGDDEGGDDGGDDSTDLGTTDNGEQNTESTSSNGTPGFEVIALIAGIALVMIALRKRK